MPTFCIYTVTGHTHIHQWSTTQMINSSFAARWLTSLSITSRRRSSTANQWSRQLFHSFLLALSRNQEGSLWVLLCWTKQNIKYQTRDPVRLPEMQNSSVSGNMLGQFSQQTATTAVTTVHFLNSVKCSFYCLYYICWCKYSKKKSWKDLSLVIGNPM